LGIKNLRLLNTALRMRWRWFDQTGEAKPWSGLQFNLSVDAEQLFLTATTYKLGDGKRFRFWRDAWMGGKSALQLAPDLMKLVAPSLRRTSVRVQEAPLHNDNWIQIDQRHAVRGGSCNFWNLQGSSQPYNLKREQRIQSSGVSRGIAVTRLAPLTMPSSLEGSNSRV
jgi:hypothetical protein